MGSVIQLVMTSSGILMYAVAMAWHNKCARDFPLYFVGLHIGFLLLLALMIGIEEIVQIWKNGGFGKFIDFAFEFYNKHALGLIFANRF